MTPAGDHNDLSNDLDLPAQLRADLRALDGEAVAVPPEVDRAIVGAARAQFGRQRTWRLVLRWGGGIAAAAALLLVAMQLVPAPPHRPDGMVMRTPTAPTRSAPIAQDVNGDGTVDVLDALALARQVKEKRALDPRWDLNGDGVVNDGDAAAISHVAVSTRGGVER